LYSTLNYTPPKETTSDNWFGKSAHKQADIGLLHVESLLVTLAQTGCSEKSLSISRYNRLISADVGDKAQYLGSSV